MTARAIGAITSLLIFAFAAGCGPGDLSRGGAENLIKEHQRFAKLNRYVRTHGGAFDKGYGQGYWSDNKSGSKLRLTQKGREHFNNADVLLYELRGLYLKKPTASASLEVTGIAKKGENEREAQFKWQYGGLPSVAKRFAVSGGTGTAEFQRFDDGWRVTDLDVDYSSSPARLTSEERREERAEIRKIEERKRAEVKRRKKLLISAKQVTSELNEINARYDASKKKGSGHMSELACTKATVTNASVILTCDSGYRYTRIGRRNPWNGEIPADDLSKIEVWFGNVKKVSTGSISELNVYGVYMSGPEIGTYRIYFNSDDRDVRDNLANSIREAQREWNEKYSEVRNWSR